MAFTALRPGRIKPGSAVRLCTDRRQGVRQGFGAAELVELYVRRQLRMPVNDRAGTTPLLPEGVQQTGSGQLMSDQSQQPARPDSDEIASSRLVPQVGMMLQAFWASPVRTTLLGLGGLIFLVIAVTAYGQIRLNRWNEPFYDALARHDVHEFVVQLGIFGIIAGALLVLNVFQRWLTETIKLKLRDGLTRDLVDLWMLPRRAFRLASAGPIGVNPDQRMHEDARRLTELSADLGIGLLQAAILLVTFVGVLWTVSADFAFVIGGRAISIPGYMVWAGF